MADWWTYGIRGKNGLDNLAASGSLTQPSAGFYNMGTPRSAGTWTIQEASEAYVTYRRLITTLSSGTQVYLEVETKKYTGSFHLPDETLNYMEYPVRLLLYKNGTSLKPSGAGYVSGSWARSIAGEVNIYNYNYRTTSGNFVSPADAYPSGKSSAGGTNRLAITTNSNGITFWVLGFPMTTSDNTYYSCPCSSIGTINATTLNNRFWFDPEVDALSEEEMLANDNDAGIDGRPTDPGYNGTDIDFPSLPSGASAIGFSKMSIYHPTSAQLGSALDILWSDTTETTLENIVESAKKWWYKPEQYAVSLMITPVPLTDVSTKNICFGKYDSEVASATVNQWAIVDCGSLSIPLKTGSFLDFAPYVKTSIYLPFVGIRSIDSKEIMGGTIAIKYYVDLFSGAALCMMRVSNTGCNNSVLYTFNCNVNEQIPLTSNNYNGVVSNLLSAGLSAGMGNLGSSATSIASAVAGMGAPDVKVSGNLSPNTGILGSPKPYVIIHFPVEVKPQSFNDAVGKVSNIYVNLGSITGYTEVDKIHLNIPGITDDELNDLLSLLDSGVVF